MASNMQFFPGDIIQNFEEPIVKLLKEEYNGQCCNSCFLRKPLLQQCRNCNKVFYCNSTCQIVDWQNCHSVECRIFSIADFEGDGALRVIKLLAYLKLNDAKAKKKYQIYNGKSRCFDDLQDHHSELSHDQTLRDGCEHLAMALRQTNLFTLHEASVENLVHLYGIWVTNGYQVRNEENTQTVGDALYVAASVFDHSCRPNAQTVYDASFRVQIRCIEAIPFGQEPRITFYPPMAPMRGRQAYLRKKLFCTCDCTLCEKEKDKPAVNYFELRLCVTELMQKDIFSVDDFRHVEYFLGELQKMFCKYDERITWYYKGFYDKFIWAHVALADRSIPLSELKEFGQQVVKNMLITYGHTHKNYEDLMKQMKALPDIIDPLFLSSALMYS